MNLLDSLSYQEEMNYNLLNNSTQIKRIDVTYASIRSLPILPLHLEELCADDNEDLVELPINLPSNLRILSLCLTGIRKINTLWPYTLQQLYISENPGIIFNTFPPRLKIFSGNSCEFSYLPPFPDTLIHISVADNNLITLPPFPPSLEYLNIANNKIKKIPKMPNTVDTFICCNNEISTFVNISTNLMTFHCANNKIIKFPNLPLKLTIQQPTKITFICWENPLIYDFNSAYNQVSFINCINNFVEIYSIRKIQYWFRNNLKKIKLNISTNIEVQELVKTGTEIERETETETKLNIFYNCNDTSNEVDIIEENDWVTIDRLTVYSL